MIAETAYNVFQALSFEEQQRMLSMIVIPAKPKKAVKKTISISDAEVKEMIITKFKKWNNLKSL